MAQRARSPPAVGVSRTTRALTRVWQLGITTCTRARMARHAGSEKCGRETSVRCVQTVVVDSEMEVDCGEDNAYPQITQIVFNICVICGWLYALAIFQYRQNISRRIFEPCDRRRAMWTTSNAAFVSLDIRQIVVFEHHAHAGEFVHCRINVVHMKIQDGERGRGVVWFGIQENGVVRGMKLESFRRFGTIQSEYLTVEVF